MKVGQFYTLLLQILTQIGGGPEAPENNLVRFALPAIFWAILLAVAWSRQRHGDYPRERLLVWGFGLALFRELFMLGHLSEKLIGGPGHVDHSSFVEPLEHFLAITAIVVISAAFLRYILDDPVLPRRYLYIGLGVIGIGYFATAFWWPNQALVDSSSRFNMTMPAFMLHTAELILIGAAIVILIRKKGWLRNTVLIGLSFLFISELINLFNYSTAHVYGHVLCPIGNNLHIWAVPIFGFVYLREQSLEKNKAESDLRAYQGHLEVLVELRTAELKKANKQLERTAVLEERQRIAAEMHDGLAQTLSSMGLKTGQAAAMLQDGKREATIGELDEMQDIIARAVSDVRRSIASLQQNPQPRQSLQDALRQLSPEAGACLRKPDIIHVMLEEPFIINVHDQEQILRVVQEALLNACRHSQSAQIRIDLGRVAGGFMITVRDQGRGFDPLHVSENNGHHFGLSIMRARAARINGQLQIISAPGEGTTVRLCWPAEFIPPNGTITRPDNEPVVRK